MALDFSLYIIPTQFRLIFQKAEENSDYAEFVASAPKLLYNEDFEDFKDPTIIELKNDVKGIKKYLKYQEHGMFYDNSRCSATIDYLINQYIDHKKLNLSNNILWHGGQAVSERITSATGHSIKIYSDYQIIDISNLLKIISFTSLINHYDYAKMCELGVYKVVRPEYLAEIEVKFNSIKKIFDRAARQKGVMIFKTIS